MKDNRYDFLDFFDDDELLCCAASGSGEESAVPAGPTPDGNIWFPDLSTRVISRAYALALRAGISWPDFAS